MSAMKKLSIALTLAAIEHTCEPASDNLEDDSVEISRPTPDGGQINIQCVTEFSPRGQANYCPSVFINGVFYNTRSFESNEPNVIASIVADLISGKKKYK